MKIFITGGTTFISKFAAAYFAAKGDEVTVLNRGSREQVKGVKPILCDRMRLGDTLRGKYFDLILDITAYTREHIETLLESGVSFGDFIFVSSSAVYPETNRQPFTEDQTCGFNAVWGDYGLNKLKADGICMNRFRMPISSVRRISTVSMRICTVRRFLLIAPCRTGHFISRRTAT